MQLCEDSERNWRRCDGFDFAVKKIKSIERAPVAIALRSCSAGSSCGQDHANEEGVVRGEGGGSQLAFALVR